MEQSNQPTLTGLNDERRFKLFVWHGVSMLDSYTAGQAIAQALTVEDARARLIAAASSMSESSRASLAKDLTAEPLVFETGIAFLIYGSD